MNSENKSNERKTENPMKFMRLNAPGYPARKQLDEASKIINGCIQLMVINHHTVAKINGSQEQMINALRCLDDAIIICPDDLDLLVAKAGILNAFGQFKSAEELLDQVLVRDSFHFEAKMWKNNWNSWTDAIRFPDWNCLSQKLHPVMKSHLDSGHRIQIVRHGLQKTLAFVAEVGGPPFDELTEVQVEWVISETPYGSLVAYYPKITEPNAEPSMMEAFLPIFEPGTDQVSPLEGFFLMQQLNFTCYLFAILVSGNEVLLNRKIIASENTIIKIQNIVSQLVSNRSFLPQNQFENAMQWHMNNFNMNQLTFDSKY